MATQPTNLPVPSESPRDLKFNAGKIDEFVTSLNLKYSDRFGGEHYTIEGLRQIAQQAISAFGWVPMDSFQDGATLTLPNQVLRWKLPDGDGDYYRWDGAFPKVVPAASTPESTGGIGAGKWLSIGDAVLRTELSSDGDGEGDELIAVKQPVANAVPRTQHSKNSDILNIRDFGAACDGVTDDTAAIQAAVSLKGGVGITKIMFPAGANVIINGTVLVPGGAQIDLNSCILRGNDTNTMFESARYIDGVLTSNWGDSASTSVQVDLRIYNAVVRNTGIFCRLYNVTANSGVYDVRGFNLNQLLHAKECFYADFHNLLAWQPLSGTTLPCFHWEGDIQAQGVRKCYVSGWPTGHIIQGFNDVDCFDTCSAEGCVVGVYITGGPGGGGLQNIDLHNWYLESNGTAIKADPAYTHQRVNIRNSWLYNNNVHLDGPTIISGGIDRSCVIQDTADHPGNINMSGNNAGQKGFIIELNEYIGNANVNIPTIPLGSKYYLGPNVRMSKVVTLADSSGIPYVRNKEETTIPAQKFTGNTVGSIPDNVVPFCSVQNNGTNAIIGTQFPTNAFGSWIYNLQVVDSSGSWRYQGVICGNTIIPAAGQKNISVSSTSDGKLAITLSGGLSGIRNIKGVIKAI